METLSALEAKNVSGGAGGYVVVGYFPDDSLPPHANTTPFPVQVD
jgi:hypothetical protein